MQYNLSSKLLTDPKLPLLARLCLSKANREASQCNWPATVTALSQAEYLLSGEKALCAQVTSLRLALESTISTV
jgi:hypothetical protein